MIRHNNNKNNRLDLTVAEFQSTYGIAIDVRLFLHSELSSENGKHFRSMVVYSNFAIFLHYSFSTC